MRLRPLPVVEEIARIAAEDPKRAVEYQNALVLETFKTKGFQFIFHLLGHYEHDVTNALRAGGLGRSEHILGQLYAIERFRREIVALLPDDSTLEEAEEEVELPVYESPFDVPLPVG